jgi:cytochrome c553
MRSPHQQRWPRLLQVALIFSIFGVARGGICVSDKNYTPTSGAACHRIDGRGEQANRVPRIAGQHYPYLRRQIEAAADLHKELAPPEMTSALRGMRLQEKDALADYISRLGDAEAPFGFRPSR